MQASWYELLSLSARYWFILLGLLIVYRSFRWLRKDRAARHKLLDKLPAAGSIGYFEVLSGSGELPVGCSLPVPHEGVLGYLRLCDVTVPVKGVANRHCDLLFRDRVGLIVTPRNRQQIRIDSLTVVTARDARETPMCHNSVLEIGDAVLRLKVYMGVDVEHRPLTADDAEPPAEAPAGPEAPQTPDLPQADAPYRMGVPQLPGRRWPGENE